MPDTASIRASRLSLDEARTRARSVRFAAFDIDGTLTDPLGVVRPEVIEAIRSLSERGVQVALATGRPSFATRSIANQILAKAPSLYFSGALVQTPDQQTTLLRESFARERVNSLVQFAQKNSLYVEVYTDQNFYIFTDHGYAYIHGDYLGMKPTIVKDLDAIEGEIIKVLYFAKRGTQQHAAAERVRRDNPDLNIGLAPAPKHATLDLEFFNITTKGGTRERCLDLMLKHCGVTTEQMIAFGDAHSDLVFLRRAAIGVAMGDAADDVKKDAAIICPPSSASGVARAIGWLFGDR